MFRRLVSAHPGDVPTELADLKRQVTATAAQLRGRPGSESELADVLDQLVAELEVSP